MDLKFYKEKVVLVTGHTGFKGSWLCKILINSGAKVVGYALKPPTNPNLFSLSKIESQMVSVIGDIRDYNLLKETFDKYQPECVIHLAAQSIVIDGYKNPKYTYETNVMGTVNVCECVRTTSSVKSFLNVTTDKVYFNSNLSNHAFVENEPLDGYDPYSNSKSCSELVTHSYKNLFFNLTKCAVSTARAGNVLGGGDFAKYRIIPDCVRAIEKKENIVLRNPYSIRPYQHVFDALYMYLEIVQKQYENKFFEGYYNIGPDESDCITTGSLVTKFCNKWGNNLMWIGKSINGYNEAPFLKLDNNKIKKTFGWVPKWNIDECINKIVEFTRKYMENANEVPNEMDRQINEFFN